MRGLEYYTGPVYEAELLAEIPNEDGQIVRFGSVGGGGRYDGLVSRFRGEPVINPDSPYEAVFWRHRASIWVYISA